VRLGAGAPALTAVEDTTAPAAPNATKHNASAPRARSIPTGKALPAQCGTNPGNSWGTPFCEHMAAFAPPEPEMISLSEAS
jgi:hypothetical protein